MEKEQLMENTIAVTKKRVFGRVKFNEGWYCEIETFGIEGVEKNILLDTIQVDNEEMREEQFRQEFRVGSILDITTIREVRRRLITRP
jgi:hypothetical protein